MRIAIFGIGGHAKVVAEIIEAQKIHEIIGFISHDGKPKKILSKYDVIGKNTNLDLAINEYTLEGTIIGLGDIQHRKELIKLINNRCYLL